MAHIEFSECSLAGDVPENFIFEYFTGKHAASDGWATTANVIRLLAR